MLNDHSICNHFYDFVYDENLIVGSKDFKYTRRI
jgi:hypothetical protein